MFCCSLGSRSTHLAKAHCRISFNFDEIWINSQKYRLSFHCRTTEAWNGSGGKRPLWAHPAQTPCSSRVSGSTFSQKVHSTQAFRARGSPTHPQLGNRGGSSSLPTSNFTSTIKSVFKDASGRLLCTSRLRNAVWQLAHTAVLCTTVPPS